MSERLKSKPSSEGISRNPLSVRLKSKPLSESGRSNPLLERPRSNPLLERLKWKPYSVATLLVIYFIVSIGLAASWHKRGINSVTGDEPAYLVMANGIGKYRTFEQTKPYLEEFQTRQIYKNGLAPVDAIPSTSNSETILSKHGLYNIHNIGLPILLSVPYAVGGIKFAKLFMILLCSIVVYGAWKFSSLFSDNIRHRFWSVLAVTISMPLIPASNQIFPDMVAGAFALMGLYWIATTMMKRKLTTEIGMAAMVAYLPWLQLKFASACAILFATLIIKIFLESRNWIRVATITSIAAVSASLLVSYNVYAYENASGPYAPGALVGNKTSLMVMLGLQIDQNQGFLFQNVLYFAGLVGVGLMFRQFKFLSALVIVLFLSLVTLNAMHPNWYGGGSFSSRFAWSATVIFFVPVLFALLRLASVSSRIWAATLGATGLIQLCFLGLYGRGVSLYNRSTSTLPSGYTNLYYPFDNLFPKLYNVSWAFQYFQNYVWIFLVAIGLVAGFTTGRSTVVMRWICASTLCLTGVSSFWMDSKFSSTTFESSTFLRFPSQAGQDSIEARAGVDAPDYLTSGPFSLLKSGKYEAKLTYSSPASSEIKIGIFSVRDQRPQPNITSQEIKGTDGTTKVAVVAFNVKSFNSDAFSTEIFWNGDHDITINQIEFAER